MNFLITGSAIVFVGLLVLGYLYYKKTAETIISKVVSYKNKSHSGRKYCFPDISIPREDGTSQEMRLYHLQRKRHDSFEIGEEILIIKYTNLFGKLVYVPLARFYKNAGTIIFVGVAVMIYHFFQ